MKAATYKRYGGPEVIEIVDLPKPVPGNGEILIRVRATTVTSGDWRVRSLDLPAGFGLFARPAFGLAGPRQPVLGSEASGIVEAVGPGVTRFAPGNAVFAFRDLKMGCHAEYVTMPAEGAVETKPAKLSFEEAAALSFGGCTALAFLRKAAVKAGDAVLVVGASGGVGSAAVQLARHFGAEVTGVTSARNADLVRSLGATRTVDYATQDFARDGSTYDVILDTTGTAPYRRASNALRDGGRLALVLASLADLATAPWYNWRTKHRIIAGPTGGGRAELKDLADMAQAGAYRPLIDAVYPFERIADAHRHVDTGRKRGNVVVSVADT